MHTAILKIAPTGLILLMMAYCCWPYLEQPDAAMVEEPNEFEKMAAALITPVLKATPMRNPFLAKDTSALSLAKDDNAKARELQCELAIEDNPESTPDAQLELGSLALEGTFVRGKRSAAIINGNVYRKGQRVSVNGVEQSGLIVTRIFPQKVLLRRDGQTFELGYPNATRKPKLPPTNPAETAEAAAARNTEPNPTTLADLIFRSSHISELLRREQKPIQKKNSP